MTEKYKEELNFTKAEEKDLPDIMRMIQGAIAQMKKEEIDQWDDLYPNETDIREDINKGQLFKGMIGNLIFCIFVLNQEMDGQYENGNWSYQGPEFIVIHRLCISPSFQGKKLGQRTMEYILEQMEQEGKKAVRLDVFTKNPGALTVYKKAGFLTVGEAVWRKGRFYLQEKLTCNQK